MSGNNTENDSSAETTSTRRKVLKGIGGVGIGLGIGGAGVLALADQSDHVNRAAIIGPKKPEKTPGKSRPTESDSEETPAPRTTPWDKGHLIVSIERNDGLGRFDHVYAELDKAVEFWNDYLEANVQFDLTLSFERDHTNPDILFNQVSIMDACFGEYDSPATDDEYLSPLVCVETLRETPSETPVTATMGKALHGEALYGLIVKHAIGRLIGFDIWTDPVDVMTPEILFGPAHADQPGATSILSSMYGGIKNLEDFRDMAERSIRELEESEEPVGLLPPMAEDISKKTNKHESAVDEWKQEAEGFGFPGYGEAYDKTVRNDEVAYLRETVSVINDIAGNASRSNRGQTTPAENPSSVEDVIDRFEHISSWVDERERFDVQIHRKFTEISWSEWADE